ncbi:hypothetical protein NDU88_001033 [Pleurodeles waltl]|uniref:Uncharacterized protein n=1 Tax=Pleurodeles waltl TaxID=8319 RepID=A0AAV7R9W2_PLEWA|nr:hypothetical protein NDU88_001033 [Pleurodeles waltl]
MENPVFGLSVSVWETLIDNDDELGRRGQPTSPIGRELRRLRPNSPRPDGLRRIKRRQRIPPDLGTCLGASQSVRSQRDCQPREASRLSRSPPTEYAARVGRGLAALRRPRRCRAETVGDRRPAMEGRAAGLRNRG